MSEPLDKLTSFYVSLSGDPLISGANRLYGPENDFTWFRSFLWLELYVPYSLFWLAPHLIPQRLFQFPVFILGARALWKGEGLRNIIRIVCSNDARLPINISRLTRVRSLDHNDDSPVLDDYSHRTYSEGCYDCT